MSLDTIFVNLPVKDLDRAVAFYEALGFTRHPIFHGEGATCMVISEHIHLMLQTADHMKRFTAMPIADPTRAMGVMLCLHCDSPAHVDSLVKMAVQAGGTADGEAETFGDFIYSHGFIDPEGYAWKMNHIFPGK